MKVPRKDQGTIHQAVEKVFNEAVNKTVIEPKEEGYYLDKTALYTRFPAFAQQPPHPPINAMSFVLASKLSSSTKCRSVSASRFLSSANYLLGSYAALLAGAMRVCRPSLALFSYNSLSLATDAYMAAVSNNKRWHVVIRWSSWPLSRRALCSTSHRTTGSFPSMQGKSMRFCSYESYYVCLRVEVVVSACQSLSNDTETLEATNSWANPCDMGTCSMFVS